MNQPTKEQIKRFWEQCGAPTLLDNMQGGRRQLDIDLNSLFQFAVPKVKELLPELKWAKLFVDWLQDVLYDDKDPALALFWAIYKAFEVK